MAALASFSRAGAVQSSNARVRGLHTAPDLSDGHEGSDHKSYGIVIDAGSTGCRLHVYSWPRRTFSANDLPPPDLTVPIELVGSVLKSTPGIDSAAGVVALKDIITKAKASAPFSGSDDDDTSVVADTPIYLKATAGLRILPVEDQARQLDAVRALLRSSGFSFKSDSQARVISGEEEGVFGWISVNYAMGKLQPSPPGSLTGSFGALDLGGASTQVTFKPTDPNILADSFPLGLGSAIREDLYTHSFLYYGANEARTRMNQAVMFAEWPSFPAGSPPARINNPCNFAGFEENFTDPRTGAMTTMVGAGDFAACRAGPLASLINKRAVCLTVPRPTKDKPSLSSGRLLAQASPAPAINTVNMSTCSVQGEYQPVPKGVTFVAFSSFTFVWNVLEMPSKGGTLQDFANRSTALCGKTWQEVQSQFPSIPPQFLNGYCFAGAYTVAMLVDGYGLDATDASALIVESSPDAIGWALGSIIYEANSLRYAVNLPFVVPFAAVLAVAILSICALSIMCLLWFNMLPAACRVCGCCKRYDNDPARMSTSPTSTTRNPLAESEDEDDD